MSITENEIRLLLKTRGWKQADLARELGVTQPTVSRWLAGKIPDPPQQDRLAGLMAEKGLRSGFNPPPQVLGERDLKVFAAAEGGEGEMVVSNEPVDFTFRPTQFLHVRDAYAVLITGTSMEPRYEPGEMVYVHPKAPLVRDKDVILVNDNEESGEFRASIKRLVRWENHQWYVRQHNPPKEWWAPKKVWPNAFRVYGRWDG